MSDTEKKGIPVLSIRVRESLFSFACLCAKNASVLGRMNTYAGNLELNKLSLFKSDLFTLKSFVFYPSCLCSSDIWGGLGGRDAAVWAIALSSKVLFVKKSSLFFPSVCVISSHTQILSVLPFYVCIHSHTSHLGSTLLSVCVVICSHTSPLCSTLLSVFLSVHTQALLFYPSVCVLICLHVISVLPICLCHLFTHIISVLPFCLCSYLFSHRSSLFYPTDCVLICSHTSPCSTALCYLFKHVISVLPICLCSYLFTHKSSLFYPSVCLCSSDLWGGPGRRDAAVWAIQGAAQPPASVARVTHHQLCWHSVTGSAHCPSRGPCGM